MKIVNSELHIAIINLDKAKTIFLDGDINMAMVDLKKQLKSKYDIKEEARKNIFEAICSKDKEGKPITINVPIPGGHFVEYKFDTPADEKKCTDEISKIDAMESEIPDGKIENHRIMSIKCTNEQFEGLLLLAIPTK